MLHGHRGQGKIQGEEDQQHFGGGTFPVSER